jgi:aminoglycoside phosphotransferase (APT) family kinase protein
MSRSSPDSGALCARLGELLGAPPRIEHIESGTCGTSYRVATPEGIYAAKVFFPDADVLLGPATQFRLLEDLASADIAPRPIACDDAAGLLVTEWISDGKPAGADEITAPGCLKALAAALATLHSVACDIPDYRPHDYLARYIAALGGLGCLSRRDRSRHDELLDLAAALAADADPRCLCHNDLAADNCFFGSKIRFIDFDFAVAAPPIIDLASLAVMNRFDGATEQALLAAYFGKDHRRARAFAGARRLVSLLAHFWALASADAGAAIVAQYRIDDD